MARPTKRTQEVVLKLEQAFAMGATIGGASYYAGIGERTFHDWASADPEFGDRMASLREKPILKALQTVVNDLEDVATAKWYLERKHPEFRNKSQAEVSAAVTTTEKYDTSALSTAEKTQLLEKMGLIPS